MPTYEFRCPSGHEFERFYKTISGAASEAECPECGKVAGRRMSVGAGLLFKGSGFYLTDYGKNAHRGDAKREQTKEQKAEQKTEQKPEPKAEPKAERKAEPKAEPKADKGAGAESRSKPKPKPKPKSE